MWSDWAVKYIHSRIELDGYMISQVFFDRVLISLKTHDNFTLVAKVGSSDNVCQLLIIKW